MTSPYTPTTYINDSLPALSAANLNKSEAGIATATAGVIKLELPEASSSPLTAAATAANLLGKTTRFDTTGGAINQTLPAAVAGAVFAIGWDAGAAALTYTAAGSDVIGTGSATSSTLTFVGELRTLHCTTAGRWRETSKVLPGTALVLSSANTDVTGAAVGDLLAVTAVNGSNVATSFARVSAPMNPIVANLVFGS